MLLEFQDSHRQGCDRRVLSEAPHLRLSLFGSVLRDDFRPDSDVDVLVEFEPNAEIGLFEYLDAQEELESIFGRPVDLVERSALENPFRRHEILRTAVGVYAA